MQKYQNTNQLKLNKKETASKLLGLLDNNYDSTLYLKWREQTGKEIELWSEEELILIQGLLAYEENRWQLKAFLSIYTGEFENLVESSFDYSSFQESALALCLMVNLCTKVNLSLSTQEYIISLFSINKPWFINNLRETFQWEIYQLNSENKENPKKITFEGILFLRKCITQIVLADIRCSQSKKSNYSEKRLEDFLNNTSGSLLRLSFDNKNSS